MKRTLCFEASYYYYDEKGCQHLDYKRMIMADNYPSLEIYENFARLDKIKNTVNNISVNLTDKRICQIGGYDGNRGLYVEVL